MKQRILLLLLCSILSVLQSKANNGQIGNGTVPSIVQGPWSSYTDSNTLRVMHYTVSELAAIGIYPGSTIQSVKWYKNNNEVYANGATATATLYLRNVSSVYPSYGYDAAPVFAHAHINNNGFVAVGTIQFDDVSNNIGSGWIGFDNLNFAFTGAELEMYVDYQVTPGTGPTTTAAIEWLAHLTTGEYRFMYCDGTIDTANSYFTTGTVRPDVQIDFDPIPCDSNLNIGDAVSDTPGAICVGTSFGLSLVNNTFLLGQNMYTWESAPTSSGPWTTYSVPMLIPVIGVTAPLNTTWYRAKAECGMYTAYSTPVEVLVVTGMSGNFTIDDGQPTAGSNYNSFAEAMAAMNCGISGPVVFDVAAGSGPYLQLRITPVPGADANNTVTFNGNGVTMMHTPDDSNTRAAVKLDGADHIVFNNFKVIVSGDSVHPFGYGIQLMNDADYNTISNCEVTVNTTDSSYNSDGYAGIVINGSIFSPIGYGNGFCDHNRVQSNTVTGGFYGITLIGENGIAAIDGNEIRDNNIADFHSYGIAASDITGTLIEGNNISRPLNVGVENLLGISLTRSTATRVNANRIHDLSASDESFAGTMTGISMGECLAAQGTENLLTNNLIYNFKSAGPKTGVMTGDVQYLQILHNTIALEHANENCQSCIGAYGVYQAYAGVSNLEIKNNIISIYGTGNGAKHALHFEAQPTAYSFDNNDYYFPAGMQAMPYTGYLAGTAYATLADWQVAVTDEQNSLQIDPVYTDTANADFRPTSLALDNKGSYVNIGYDIMGATRSSSTPDMGAYEFDIAIVSVGAVNAATAITVYPNPASSVIHIVADKKLNAELSSIDGKVVLKKEAAQQIDISNLPDGIYMLQIKTEDGELLRTEKISKQVK